MPRAVTALLLVVVLGAGACATSSDDAGPTTTDEVTDATEDAGGLPADPTSPQLCDALPAEDVAAASGLDIVSSNGDVGPTPQCLYTFRTEDGIEGSVTVGVPRPVEDLDGLEGPEALAFAVRANEEVFDVEAEELGIADGAAYVQTADLGNVLVLQGDRVITVAGQDLDRDALAAIAVAAAEAYG